MITKTSDTGDAAGAGPAASCRRPPACRARTVSSLLAALAFAAALACAPRQATAPSAPPPPPKRLFEPYPPERVASVRNPHDFEGKPLCQRCHVPTGELIGDPVALCSGCHKFSWHNHPVNVVQRTAVDLPLMAGGKVACHTCHDPHQSKRKLRRPFSDLCLACHPRH